MCFLIVVVLAAFPHYKYMPTNCFVPPFVSVRNADKIIVLKDGRAFEEGTHDQLLALDGLYAEMWNMQLHSTSTAASQVNLLSSPLEL